MAIPASSAALMTSSSRIDPPGWITAVAPASIATGAITDAFGSLSYALNASAAMLAVGAVLAAFQGKLTPTPVIPGRA